MPEGKDLTALMSGNVPPPPRRAQPSAYRPQPQPLHEAPQVAVVTPTNGLRFGGVGQWRTILETKDRKMVTFTTERPTVTTSGKVVHIHSERFDFIMNIEQIDLLEIEFGELPPAPAEVEYTNEDEEVERGIQEASDEPSV